MGGAANTCIIGPNEQRISYMAYNGEMCDVSHCIPMLLESEPQNRFDLICNKIYKPAIKWQKENDAYYLDNNIGLAPNWYGLNLIDVNKKLILWCQSYTSLDKIYPGLTPYSRLSMDWKVDFNIAKQAAENQMLYLNLDNLIDYSNPVTENGKKIPLGNCILGKSLRGFEEVLLPVQFDLDMICDAIFNELKRLKSLKFKIKNSQQIVNFLESRSFYESHQKSCNGEFNDLSKLLENANQFAKCDHILEYLCLEDRLSEESKSFMIDLMDVCKTLLYMTIRAKDWKYLNFHDNIEAMRYCIEKEYKLTSEEHMQWDKFLQERSE